VAITPTRVARSAAGPRSAPRDHVHADAHSDPWPAESQAEAREWKSASAWGCIPADAAAHVHRAKKKRRLHRRTRRFLPARSPAPEPAGGSQGASPRDQLLPHRLDLGAVFLASQMLPRRFVRKHCPAEIAADTADARSEPADGRGPLPNPRAGRERLPVSPASRDLRSEPLRGPPTEGDDPEVVIPSSRRLEVRRGARAARRSKSQAALHPAAAPALHRSRTGQGGARGAGNRAPSTYASDSSSTIQQPRVTCGRRRARSTRRNLGTQVTIPALPFFPGDHGHRVPKPPISRELDPDRGCR